MRKGVVGILLAVLLVFSGCWQGGPSAAGTVKGEGTGISFTADALRLSRVKENIPETTAICSVEELESFIEDYVRMDGEYDRMDGAVQEYVKTAEKYDSSYFQDHFLLIAAFDGNSGSMRYEVERIDTDGQIMVKQSHYELMTSDVVYQHVFIELDNSDYAAEYQLVVRDVLLKE